MNIKILSLFLIFTISIFSQEIYHGKIKNGPLVVINPKSGLSIVNWKPEPLIFQKTKVSLVTKEKTRFQVWDPLSKETLFLEVYHKKNILRVIWIETPDTLEYTIYPAV